MGGSAELTNDAALKDRPRYWSMAVISGSDSVLLSNGSISTGTTNPCPLTTSDGDLTAQQLTPRETPRTKASPNGCLQLNGTVKSSFLPLDNQRTPQIHIPNTLHLCVQTIRLYIRLHTAFSPHHPSAFITRGLTISNISLYRSTWPSSGEVTEIREKGKDHGEEVEQSAHPGDIAVQFSQEIRTKGEGVDGNCTSRRLNAVLGEVVDGNCTSRRLNAVLGEGVDGNCTSRRLNAVLGEGVDGNCTSRRLNAVLGEGVDGNCTSRRLNAVLGEGVDGNCTSRRLNAVLGEGVDGNCTSRGLNAVLGEGVDGNCTSRRLNAVLGEGVDGNCTSRRLNAVLRGGCRQGLWLRESQPESRFLQQGNVLTG
ncbi:hypothetical protein ACRRTK_005144 [Alexandromys fortis]